MKKLTLLTFLAIMSIAARAQFLGEDFDLMCLTANDPAFPWLVFNPVTGTAPDGAWHCTATNGRPSSSGAPSSGVQCTGFFSGMNHLDTSLLVTPLCNFPTSVYGEHVYLRFDTRKDDLANDGKVTVVHADSVGTSFSALIGAVTPAFSNADTGWVTHQVDISHYIDSPFFHLAFRYTSTSATGTIWYLDNVLISATPLTVSQLNRQSLPITIIGNSTSSKIELAYTTNVAGNYKVVVYDMLGREVYSGQVTAHSGPGNYTINGLNLHPGMYCIKMGNENAYGTTKLIIQ